MSDTSVPTFRIERNTVSAPFFDAAREGRLLIRKCPACGHLYPPHQQRCTDGSVLVWRPASGRGALVTWAVDHAPLLSQELADVAGHSTIGIVELAEGPWMYTALPGVSPDRLTEGMPMQVTFLELDGGEPIPVFAAAEPDAHGRDIRDG